LTSFGYQDHSTPANIFLTSFTKFIPHVSPPARLSSANLIKNFPGLSLRPFELCKDTILLISYPGEIFMRILKLMILPLVIASLITGSASINAKMNGKIALRTFVYFLTTSLFNAVLGVSLALLIHPGDPDLHSGVENVANTKSLSLMDSILDLGR
jgi:solute carrier family 1 (glial high affinity glutamate transporter), member 2